jgi:hypothetical protein
VLSESKSVWVGFKTAEEGNANIGLHYICTYIVRALHFYYSQNWRQERETFGIALALATHIGISNATYVNANKNI